jgi:ATP-dependent DNA helicase RecG
MFSIEQEKIEYKGIAKVTSGDSGFRDLANTCVCLANAQGGRIFIGIENNDRKPPSMQIIDPALLNETITRLRNLCFNVGISSGEIETHSNGGQYFSIIIHPSLKTIATTSDGKIFIRVGDQCQPVRSEDIQRLVSEKDAFQWELQSRGEIASDPMPQINLQSFAIEIRQSKRVKDSVKQLSDIEIAEHYHLVHNGKLTNLGILWLGSSAQRSRLAYPVTVQYIVYDDQENKVRKVEWRDNAKNPKELLLDIEKEAIELTYFHEFPQGLFRKQIRHYDEKVIRELLINAIAHKSYTISGDIFIKVYNDRLEVSNPGGLPLGVTKNNILHETHRRNPHLIRILHDLELMEGEGSGYNLIYEIDSRDAKEFPEPISDFNRALVIQSSKILNQEVVLLIDFVAKNYALSQKELIALGIIARHKKIITTQLSKELQLDEGRLRSYIGGLLDKSIIISRGIKKGTEYLINPKLISGSKINIKPTLKVIELPRLKALIEESLKFNPNLSMNELHGKLGDIDIDDVKKVVYRLVKEGILGHTPDRTYRKYWLAKKH